MKPIILKTGTTFADLAETHGDFEHWFARALGWPLDRFAVIDAVAGDPLPDAGSVDGVIVTGSPANVHHHDPWSVRAGEWLAEVAAADRPLLGVCYGHQLLADALGADVRANPNGREMGVCEIEVTADDPLFDGLGARFVAVETHLDAVLTLPAGARLLARTEQTPIQAFALGENVRTCQWHPEFDHVALAHYIEKRRALIDQERGPGAADRLLAGVRPLDTGPTLLRNFVTHYLGR